MIVSIMYFSLIEKIILSLYRLCIKRINKIKCIKTKEKASNVSSFFFKLNDDNH